MKFYVSGLSRLYGSGKIAFEPVQGGWRQIPVEGNKHFRDCLRVCYVNKESRGDLMKWVKCDFVDFHVCVSSFCDDDETPVVLSESAF